MAFVESPPVLSGDTAQKLEQLYRYLQRVSDQLQTGLGNLTIENFSPELQETVTNGSGASKDDMSRQADSLKSIIVKTAEIIRSEQQELRTTLESHYQALSDQFGAYERDLTNRITATAEGIIQEYEFVEIIQDLQADTAEMQSYVTHTSEYIKTGVIGDDGSVGIEIGEKMNTATPRKVMRITKDRLSFYVNDTEVAYMSNSMLYITNSEVLNSMRMGNYVWRILQDGSMGLAWEVKS